MNKLLTLIAAFGIVFLLASCATTSHPNQKLILGTWNAQKVSIYTDPNAPPVPAAKVTTPPAAPKTMAQDTSKHRKGEKNVARTPEEIAQHQAQRLEKLLQLEYKSRLKINADKTVEKIYGGKSLKGKWKMKKDGKRMIVKSKEKGRMLLDVQYLTDSIAIIVEHFPVGDIQVKYIR